MTECCDDYVLRNMHRAMVLADIVRRLGETPKARAILDRRAAHIRAISLHATNILSAAGRRFADQPQLRADLQANFVSTISVENWETVLFGVVSLNTQLWRPLMETLRSTCWRSVLSRSIPHGPNEHPRDRLIACAPILDFSRAQRALGAFKFLPVASLSSACLVSLEGLPAHVAQDRAALTISLDALKDVWVEIDALYDDLPMLAETVDGARSYQDIVAHYPSAANITELQPRRPAAAKPAAAASTILSSL